MGLAPRVLAYLGTHRLRLAVGVGFTLAGIAVELAKPVPLAIVLDSVLSGRPLPAVLQPLLGGLGPAALLGLSAAAIVALALLAGSLTLVSNYLTIEVGQRMVNDMRVDLYAHLQKLSLGFHYRQQVGDLLFRVMADTYSVQSLVMNGFLPLCSAGLMLMGMFVVMARFDLALAVVALLVVPPLYLAITRLTSRIHGHAASSKEAESELYSRAETVIGAVKLVQAYGREARAVEDFRRGSEKSLALTLRLYSAETVFILIVDTILASGTALLVWLGAQRVLEGTLTIGGLTIVLAYLKDMYRPIQGVAGNLKEIASSRAGLDRVFQVLDVEPDIRDAPGSWELPAARGEIAFENVGFAYEAGSPVLRDVSLHIRAGEKVALVGATGAGKSTLASLALRFFDPQQGRVLVDGHDLRDLRLASLRRQVTLMLQEPILFQTTIAENIAFASDAPLEAIQDAARRAEAEPFILELPKGYDTVIGQDGLTLSGGQRQRLALARALLRHTPILILDEPTSSLDVATEAVVFRNVEELLKDRTAIIIAHRLSTARRADRIVVLDRGRIVEEGPHDALVAKGGAYAALWAQATAEGRDTVEAAP
jgi:ATP-binding cassette subfamily B protein/subfamily B ATP-binding cassette protein MsbA